MRGRLFVAAVSSAVVAVHGLTTSTVAAGTAVGALAAVA